MKFIFIFLSFLGFNLSSSTFKIDKPDPPKIEYQLENHQIIKRMSEPIEINHQADNLFRPNEYLTQAKLVLPSEDLEYMRSNKVSVQLDFEFRLEWWNAMEYQATSQLLIHQSMTSQEIAARPRQIITRLTWPSKHIRASDPFSHAILFYYDQDFNFMMAHQIENSLAEWELNDAKREAHGVPQNYRIRLTNLQLSYPVPIIFENLQTNFIEVPTFYSRQNWLQWWNEFMQIFINSEFVKNYHFDDYLLRPKSEDQPHWSNPPNNSFGYIDLFLKYQSHFYLKIYQYFFSEPRLKIIYHQYLDLAFEFGNVVLTIEPNQNAWTVFKEKYHEWDWWLNHYVEPKIDGDTLTLKSKDSNLVRGEAKIKLIKQKLDLANLNLKTTFDYLQFEDQESLKRNVFEIFKNENNFIFENELFNNYQIINTKNSHEFTLKAKEQATFTGSLTLIFSELKMVKASNRPSISNIKNTKLQLPFWIWILVTLVIACCIVLIWLKFTKSKPTKK